jgi:HAD superfamily hydrolase (TIGR01509 family)
VWARLAHRLPDGLTFEAWSAAISCYYSAHPERLVAAPGALAAFEGFAAMGLAQVCVSNSNRDIVDTNLAALGIADRIVFSISLDDVAAGKPDPTPYIEACRRLEVAPRDVVAIEDSPSGARSARRAGLTVVGYNLAAAYGRDVDIGIDGFTDLPALIASRS